MNFEHLVSYKMQIFYTCSKNQVTMLVFYRNIELVDTKNIQYIVYKIFSRLATFFKPSTYCLQSDKLENLT